jgi:hypothetical protein
MLLTAVNSNITFADTLAAGILAYTNKQALTINAGTGTVTFGGKVGYDYNSKTTYLDYLNLQKRDSVPNIYQLLVTAGKIVIEDSITTFDSQTYNGPVIIGSTNTVSKPTSIILLSEYPSVTFNGTVNDSVEGGHSLYVRAILINADALPSITFNKDVGDQVRLKSLTVETGNQKDRDNTIPNAFYSEIGTDEYYGNLNIATVDINTVYDQSYAAWGSQGRSSTDPTYDRVNSGANFSTAKDSAGNPLGKITWVKPKDNTGGEPRKCEGCGGTFNIPSVPEPTTNFTNTDLESILREQNDRTGFGGQENTPYSGSGTVNVLFCGAQDNFAEQVKQQCDDI